VTPFRTERQLARMFFGRYFESDLMPGGLPQVQVVIWAIALLAAPGYVLSFVYAIEYDRLWRLDRRSLPDVMLGDQLLFVTFGMMALGLVGLVVWERVFPDRRDVRILGMLPLARRTHVAGRLGALGAVALLFCVGVNLPSGIVYGAFLAGSEGAAGPFRGIAAHMIATGLGGLFTFFLVIAGQGLILTVFGPRAAQRLALLLQAVFVIALLQALLWVPRLGLMVRDGFGREPGMAALLFPPGWFLALYGLVAGWPRSVPAGHAVTAVAATGAAVAAAALLLVATYPRLVRLALETRPGARHRTRRLARARAALGSCFVRDQVTRAVAGYTWRTMTRSRTHLMLLASYAGGAVAIVFAGLIPVVARHGMRGLETPSVALLSAPLVCNFIVLGGLRVLFAIPTDLKANWAFRLHAPDDRIESVVAGVRLFMRLAVVVPVAVAAALIGLPWWGMRTALLHGLFAGMLGVLLADALLVGFRKIPFTCTYVPGRSRARSLLPIYLLAFSLYAYSLAGLEAALLRRPLSFLPVLTLVALSSAGFAWLRRRDLAHPPGLAYEEEQPDALFQGFRLSEGVAAESRPVQPAGRPQAG
jgi:hypothetical protein